jgi:hypothetical protein
LGHLFTPLQPEMFKRENTTLWNYLRAKI